MILSSYIEFCDNTNVFTALYAEQSTCRPPTGTH